MYATDETVSVGSIYRIVLRHKGRVAISFAVILTVVVIVAFILPRAYRSQAQLLVRLGRENVVVDPTATVGQTPSVSVPQSLENEVNSAVALLKSQVVAEDVVDTFGARAILNKEPYTGPALANAESSSSASNQGTDASRDKIAVSGSDLDERYRAVTAFTKALDVEAVRRSNVISITYEASSPELAQAVVDRVVKFYIGRHLALCRPPGAPQFLKGQTELRLARLKQVEERLCKSKDQTGLSAPESQRLIAVTRLGKLEDDLQLATTVKVGVEAEIEKLEEKLKKPVPNRVQEEATLDLFKQEVALAAAQARVKRIGDDLDQERKKLEKLNEDSLKIARLQREFESEDLDYRDFTKSLKQSQNEQALQIERISNLTIAQPATYDPKPIRMRRLLVGVLGLVLAAAGSVCLAFVFERRDHRLKHRDDGPVHAVERPG